jgi:hypothetical protein
VRLEGLDQLKNPINSSGIEPATFRLVAQCLNQLRYLVLVRKRAMHLNITARKKCLSEGHNVKRNVLLSISLEPIFINSIEIIELPRRLSI